MGAVKQWGMDLVEQKTRDYYSQGMSWQAAAEQAQEDVFGPEHPEPQEPDE